MNERLMKLRNKGKRPRFSHFSGLVCAWSSFMPVLSGSRAPVLEQGTRAGAGCGSEWGTPWHLTTHCGGCGALLKLQRSVGDLILLPLSQRGLQIWSCN